MQDTKEQKLMRHTVGAGLFLAVLALWPLTPSPAMDIKYFFLAWTVAIAGLLWISYQWRHGDVHYPRAWSGRFLGLLAASLVAASLLGNHPAYSLVESSKYLTLLLLFLAAAAAFRDAEQAWRLIALIVVAVGLSSVYGLVQKMGWDPFPWETREVEEYLTLPGTYGNPNVASHTLILGFILACGLVLRRRSAADYWAAVPALLIGTHIFISGVRSAQLALGACGLFLLLLFLSGRLFQCTVRRTVASLLLLGLIAAAGGMGALYVSKARTAAYTPMVHGQMLRYNSFLGASQMILDKPLQGFGSGAYLIENTPYWTPYEQEYFAAEQRLNEHVHNEYLEFGVEGGVLAALMYIGFLMSGFVASFVAALKANTPERRILGLATGCAFLAFLVDGLFGFNFHVPVSSALIVAIAGLQAGVFGSEAPKAIKRPPRGRFLLAAIPVGLLSLGLAVLYSLDFVSRNAVQIAWNAEASGNPDRALNLLDKGRSLAPWDFEIPERMGQIMLQYGQSQAAIALFNQALEQRPYDVAALLGKARALVNENQAAPAQVSLDDARRVAERAAEFCPSCPGVHGIFGRVELAGVRGQSAATPQSAAAWRRVVEHLTLAQRHDVDLAQIYPMLAEAYSALGDTKNALAAHQRSVKANPSDDVAWVMFVQFAEGTDNWPALSDALSKALRDASNQEPRDRETIAVTAWWLALTYMQGFNDAESGRAVLVQALDKAPDNLALWGGCVSLSPGKNMIERASNAFAAVAVPESAYPVLVRRLRQTLDGPEDLAATAKAILDDWIATARVLDKEQSARNYLWMFRVLHDAILESDISGTEREAWMNNFGNVAAGLDEYDFAFDCYAAADVSEAADNAMFQAEQRAELLSRQDASLTIPFVERLVEHLPNHTGRQYLAAMMYHRAGMLEQAARAYHGILADPALRSDYRGIIEEHLAAVLASSKESATP